MVSIIIVNYKIEKELINCIKSIISSKPKVPYEIIVIDNDEKKVLNKTLHKKFPHITYLPNKNRGFGQANNLGAKQARGEYLFFLNPDTIVFPGAIDNLAQFLKQHTDTGIVAPLLLGKDGKPYQQGAGELTPIRGIVALSFLHKFFPNNAISKDYWLYNWDRKSIKEVDVAPGTAFVIKKDLFEKIEGFDENFFLYFEEFDLCKRVKTLGYKVFIYPKASVFHEWGLSTTQSKDIKSIFRKSRWYYFRKHFGICQAVLAEAVLRANRYTLLIIFILAIGLFLRLYRLRELMFFIGDQGWFYLSARDMLTTGTMPLVGIPSSRPWLHQGPLWTYLLAGGLWLFNFNPVGGAYITVGIGVLSVLLIYIVGSKLFSPRTGIIGALFFATSPLVVLHDRMTYHTSPIPLFTLLLIYAVYQWVSGKTYYFPWIIVLLALLYNFEIATAMLWPSFLAVLLYGIWRKKAWASGIFQRNILLLSFLGGLALMVPMIVYDLTHGFVQTARFLFWIPYRIISLFGFQPQHSVLIEKIKEMITFLSDNNAKLLFPDTMLIAHILLFSSMFFLVFQVYQMVKKRSFHPSVVILSLFIYLPLLIIVINQTPSDAYLPALFPLIILVIAFSFEKIMSVRRLLPFSVFILFVIVLFNSLFLVRNDFSLTHSLTLQERIQAAKKIIIMANGKKYNLVGRGQGSEFSSFTMNYEYLIWWLGSPPSKNREQLRFIIEEKQDKISVKKEYD